MQKGGWIEIIVRKDEEIAALKEKIEADRELNKLLDSEIAARIEGFQKEIADLKNKLQVSERIREGEKEILLKEISLNTVLWLKQMTRNGSLQEIAELEAKMDEYENVIRLVKLDAASIHELSSRQTEGIAALKAEIKQLKFGHEPLPCPRADK